MSPCSIVEKKNKLDSRVHRGPFTTISFAEFTKILWPWCAFLFCKYARNLIISTRNLIMSPRRFIILAKTLIIPSYYTSFSSQISGRAAKTAVQDLMSICYLHWQKCCCSEFFLLFSSLLQPNNLCGSINIIV